MVYDEDSDEEEEEYDFCCDICNCECTDEAIAITLRDDENSHGDSMEDMDICNDCLKTIMKKAKIPTETKVVEKIIEKPVEKIVYRTVDAKGKEVSEYSSNKTKFD